MFYRNGHQNKKKKTPKKKKNRYEIQFNGTIESNTTLRNQIKSSQMISNHP